MLDLKKSVDLCPTMPMSWATWGIALFKLGTTDEQVTVTQINGICKQVACRKVEEL